MRFLLVDRITDIESGVRIAGTKQVAMSEDILEWHFPERPILPGMLLIEAGVQLAGWLAAAESDFRDWILLDRVERARFLRFVVPGERAELAVVWQTPDGDHPSFTVHVGVDGEDCAQIECRGVRVALEDLDDQAASRRTYALLRGEDPDA